MTSGSGQPAAAVRERLTAAGLRMAAGFSRCPWYVQVTLLYGLCRLFSWLVLLGVARQQGPNPWGVASPGYLDFVGIWDGAWYHRIFLDGYPEDIPRDAQGRAQENSWAFYALFPAVVRVAHLLSGVEWRVLAPLTSTVAGFAAALLIYRLFREFAGHGNALWGTVLVAVFPVSPILQVPYAESLHLMLLAAALLLVVRRRYAAAMPVVVLMCLARPAGVPFAVAVGLLFLYRWRHRVRDPFGAPEAARLAGLALVSALAALIWPAAAWLYTGEAGAYTETETVWRGQGLTLFVPWFDTGRMLFGPVAGVLAPVLLVVLAALYLGSVAVRRLGIELRLWCGAYLVYLFAFLYPQTSTFRLLMPLFPLALAAVFVSPSRAYRGAVVVMFALLQIVWVAWLWAWAELPGGGDYPP